MKVRRRPLVTEAVQWLGNNYAQLSGFAGEAIKVVNASGPGVPANLALWTTDGFSSIHLSDWVVGGPDAFEVLDAQSFAETYEAEEADGDAAA